MNKDINKEIENLLGYDEYECGQPAQYLIETGTYHEFVKELTNLLTKQVEEARLLGKLDVAKEVENKIGDSTCCDIGAAIRYADSLLKKYQKQYLTNLRKEQE